MRLPFCLYSLINLLPLILDFRFLFLHSKQIEKLDMAVQCQRRNDHVLIKPESLGITRRQQSAPRSLEARLAPAALARELGEQG